MKKRRSRKYIAVILAAVMTLSMAGYPGIVNAKEIDVLEESSSEKVWTSEMEDQPETQPEPVTLAEPEVQPEPTVTPEPKNEPEPTTPPEPEIPPEPTTPPEPVTPSEPKPTAQPEESSDPAPTPPSEPQESTPEPAEPSETEIPGEDQPEAEKPQETVTPTPAPEKKNTGKKKNVQKKVSTQATGANAKDIAEGETISENYDDINENKGTIINNYGNIMINSGTVENNSGSITTNNGIIKNNYNSNQPSGSGTIVNQYYELILGNGRNYDNSTYCKYVNVPKEYDNKFWIKEGMKITLNNAHLKLTSEDCSLKKNDDSSYDILSVTSGKTKIYINIKYTAPNLSIDYVRQRFIGLDTSIPYYYYSLGNGAWTYSLTTKNSIGRGLFGSNLQIRYFDDDLMFGDIQILKIPDAPKRPEILSESIQKTASSIIFPVDSTWEYLEYLQNSWTDSNIFTGLKANTEYTFVVRKKAIQSTEDAEGCFASYETYITVTTAPATYTVSIPSTATSGGNISIYFDQTNPPDLGYNGKVTVKNETSDTVMDQNGNLQLTRSDQSYNVSLQLLKSDNTPLQRGETVTELQTLSDAETLTLTTPTAAFDQNGQQVADNQIPAGTYKGTLNFSISYSD